MTCEAPILSCNFEEASFPGVVLEECSSLLSLGSTSSIDSQLPVASTAAEALVVSSPALSFTSECPETDLVAAVSCPSLSNGKNLCPPVIDSKANK